MTASPDDLDFRSFIDFAIAGAAGEVRVDQEAMRVVLTLHRLTNMLVYDLEAGVHRPRGWSWPGFRLLFVLWLAGPMEAKRAAELSGMSRAAVSALVNTLERDGLVSRVTGAPDRRSVSLSLTARGTDSMREAFAAHNERERDWSACLTRDERRTLAALLTKMIDGAPAGAARRWST